MTKERFGKFIVIEGGDGAGKTSVINGLKDHFSASNFVFTKEPGGNDISDKIRSVILGSDWSQISADPLFLLFWSSRITNLETVVWPAVKRGNNVICDRFDASTFAYQIRGQKNTHLMDLFERFRRDFVSMLAPSLYIYLDVDPKIGRKRALSSRGQDTNYFDEKDLDFYNLVRAGYFEFFRTYAQNKYRVVDANRPFDEVLKEVVGLVGKNLEC